MRAHDRICLKHGEVIRANQDQLEVVLIGDADTALEFAEGTDPGTMRAYQSAIGVLRLAARRVQNMSDSLRDPRSGRTVEGARILTENLRDLSPDFASRIKGYLLSLFCEGGTLLSSRSTVLVPPMARTSFENGLSDLPDLEDGFDWSAWLDHAYDAFPYMTEGHYLFETDADRQRFRTLIGSHATGLEELEREFLRATSCSPDVVHWDIIEEASHELKKLQEQLFAAVLEDDPISRAHSTRVHVTVGEGTALSPESLNLTPVHYSKEFSADLGGLATELRRAAALLPDMASQLRTVLEAQASWAETQTDDPNWGLAIEAWIQANDPSSILDVNVTFEEKTSHIGGKGIPLLHVAQHVEPPPEVQGVWKSVQKHAEARGVHTLLLRTLLVGGESAYMTSTGEKLPDASGQPAYKSMTFANIAPISMVACQADAYAAATGTTREEALAVGSIPVVGVALHEYGHTLGEHVEFLGALGTSVEETNAQSSAVYLAARYAAESLEKLLQFEAAWMPVRRTRQGPTEAHSHSDLVLFDEYTKAGGLEITSGDEEPSVQVVDPEAVVSTAFRAAWKMRLWERGIPLRMHSEILEGVTFDPRDSEQDARIARAADQLMTGRGDVEVPRAEVVAEVETFFALDRLKAIARRLEPVLAHMPPEQPRTIIPTDRHVAMLMGEE